MPNISVSRRTSTTVVFPQSKRVIVTSSACPPNTGTGLVQSVAGKIGVVTLGIADILGLQEALIGVDFTADNLVVSADHINQDGKIVGMLTKAGPFTDEDFGNPVDGCFGYDTLNNKLWVRAGGIWKSSGAFA